MRLLFFSLTLHAMVKYALTVWYMAKRKFYILLVWSRGFFKLWAIIKLRGKLLELVVMKIHNYMNYINLYLAQGCDKKCSYWWLSDNFIFDLIWQECIHQWLWLLSLTKISVPYWAQPSCYWEALHHFPRLWNSMDALHNLC